VIKMRERILRCAGASELQPIGVEFSFGGEALRVINGELRF
jgi:hypothetical protein